MVLPVAMKLLRKLGVCGARCRKHVASVSRDPIARGVRVNHAGATHTHTHTHRCLPARRDKLEGCLTAVVLRFKLICGVVGRVNQRVSSLPKKTRKWAPDAQQRGSWVELCNRSTTIVELRNELNVVLCMAPVAFEERPAHFSSASNVDSCCRGQCLQCIDCHRNHHRCCC